MPDLQPNFLTVNSDGSIGASFPGGAVIPALADTQYFNNPAVNPDVSIQWERTTDGARVAMIIAGNEPVPGPATDATLSLFAFDPDDPPDNPTNGDFANLQLAALNSFPVANEPPLIAALTRRSGALQDRLILDGIGRSSFIQNRPIFPPEKLETYFLATTLTWGVASTHSNVQGYSMPWSPTGAIIGAEVAGDIICVSAWPPVGANPMFIRGCTVNHAVIGPGNANIFILAWRLN